MRPNEPVQDPEELAAMLDALMASGTEHIRLAVGEETRVRTFRSTDCCKNGACAIPTLGKDPDDEDEFRNGGQIHGK